MIHVFAAKDRGIDLTSFGTTLDEPPTGLIFKKSMNIKGIENLRGKNICYIGEVGKIMVGVLISRRLRTRWYGLV